MKTMILILMQIQIMNIKIKINNNLFNNKSNIINNIQKNNNHKSKKSKIKNNLFNNKSNIINKINKNNNHKAKKTKIKIMNLFNIFVFKIKHRYLNKIIIILSNQKRKMTN